MDKIDTAIREGFKKINEGAFREAIKCFSIALDLNPHRPDILSNLGYCHQQLHQHGEAINFFKDSLSLEPTNTITWSNLGNSQLAINRHREAEESYRTSIKLAPQDARSHYNLGNLFFLIANVKEAIASYKTALSLAPSIAEINNNLALCYITQEDYPKALKYIKAALNINALYPEALNNQGLIYYHLHQYENSLSSFNHALQLRPNYVQALTGKANVLCGLMRYEEALKIYDAVIKLAPQTNSIKRDKASALAEVHRVGEAIAIIESLTKLEPKNPTNFILLAKLQKKSNLYSLALENLNIAIQLDPSCLSNRLDRAELYIDIGEPAMAIVDLTFIYNTNPDHKFILGYLLHAKMQICDWGKYAELTKELKLGLGQDKQLSNPFNSLGLYDSPSIHKKAAENYLNLENIKILLPPINLPRQDRKKLKIGYFSADFRIHPVSSLIAELIELHDKSNFEVIAFNLSENKRDTMQDRLRNSFSNFIDVYKLAPIEIAKIARSHQIDIAIDLGGYTRGSKPEIFIQRAAPIQINFLGYPGTLGLPQFDYIIGDSTIIEISDREFYTEKVITLPHSYQPNDRKRQISSSGISRAQFGLPEDYTVFCCFNNTWKITPDIFRSWMHILSRVSNSVLWLYATNKESCANLKKEAINHGVNPDRVVFTGSLPMDKHLERYQLADLFLDTFPYGAHTTASDALWSGLPVLTYCGRSFQSRVASSLLGSIGLPDMVTHCLDQYEQKAIDFGNNYLKRSEIKLRLQKNRLSYPLFDAPLHAQKLENAYHKAYERWANGLDPEDIWIS